MITDTAKVELIVEVIAREVLIALAEQKQCATELDGDYCTEECAEGICVKTCFDRVGLFSEQWKYTQDTEMWLRL